VSLRDVSAISAALSALGEIRRERSSAISAFRLRFGENSS
jgi:hypothetical protein